MQGMQDIPNPDINSVESNEDFGSHSAVEQDLDNSQTHNTDIERPAEDIPLPPDNQSKASVEEPPDEEDRAPVEEDNTEPKRLV